jgi:hypothetical protein
MTLVMPSHEAILKYSGIDLADVAQIKFGVTLAPTYFSGGTLEVVLDDENGQVIGTGQLEVGLTDMGMKDFVVSISPTQGIHNLLLKFKCKDTSKIFAGLVSLEFMKRK